MQQLEKNIKLKNLLRELEKLKLIKEVGPMAGILFDVLNRFIDEKSQLENDFKETVAEIKASVPNLDTMFKSVKGNTGEIGPIGPKGDSPTKEELLDLIEPLIPEPINGKDGRTPIHIGKKLPSNPQKGDLWY